MLYALYKLYGDVDIPTATFELRWSSRESYGSKPRDNHKIFYKIPYFILI